MYAQLRGNSQSLVKVVSGGVARSPDWRPAAVVHETPVSALIDGGGDFGMLVVRQAVELAAAKAAEHGVGVVGTNNTASGTGALGCVRSHLENLCRCYALSHLALSPHPMWARHARQTCCQPAQHSRWRWLLHRLVLARQSKRSSRDMMWHSKGKCERG